MLQCNVMGENTARTKLDAVEPGINSEIVDSINKYNMYGTILFSLTHRVAENLSFNYLVAVYLFVVLTQFIEQVIIESSIMVS